MATVKCPSCDRQLEVEDAYRDWTVRCPHCGNEFVPDDVLEAEARADDRPRRRRRRDEDDYDRDRDERDRDDREDRDEDSDYDRDSVRAEALQLVAAPSMWLELCGWLSVLGTLGLTALFLVLAAEAANNPPAGPNGDPPELFVFLGCCSGVFGVPYGVAMAIGARAMRHLSSRGWAMTGGILGIAGFTLCGVFGVVHTAFGAWALITLDKPAVREAFGLPPRPGERRRRTRRGDWDD